MSISCQSSYPEVEQWHTYEITLSSTNSYDNPYTDVDVWAVFFNQAGDTLIRPGFWSGGNSWKIRFATPDDSSFWSWKSFSSNINDSNLHGKMGRIKSIPSKSTNRLLTNGLLEMSPVGRNVVHKNGQSFVIVGDTPWALPFRATIEQVQEYASFRKAQGFNTALLMVVQPDMDADGPSDRGVWEGFARGFFDLHKGHINQLNPEYFNYLDTLIDILIENEIVPVYQPLFHGFGWKGLRVLGNEVDSDEYVRFCKYLLARYGSKPAMWLLSADNDGKGPGIVESGLMLEEWDCYWQPTGLHYNPCSDFQAPWADEIDHVRCFHYDKSYQDAEWLDFQWAQTGHSGVHDFSKVWRMYDNHPIKAVANGEPTYEGMGGGSSGLGWWQGHDAWMQLMSGGTMGVVYGAAGLWQWQVTYDEPGWDSWASQRMSWRDAMKQDGANYVGLISRVFNDLNVRDIERRWDLNIENHPMLVKGKHLYIAYLPQGGVITIPQLADDMNYKWFNPVTGLFTNLNPTFGTISFTAPEIKPYVLVITR
ncbi:apiosidase-like domain-containing protein [Alkaliflexus imshenetskii]|uniref:apiosidase-like domain-containing protein n=1 Tax=Alkaliflexus imshenetskii TaxID=286730 RepID=UPI0005C6BC09|nr:DUF4038 domain-containing protein [Alkaliflexus imshenetskii]